MKAYISKSHVEGELFAPTSKSYAQRAIASALLAPGRSVIRKMELCDDTQAALNVCEILGAEYLREDSGDWIIRGGFNPRSGTINIGESGLSARMFTPIAALTDEPITITGTGSILHRPMIPLTDPLRELGVDIRTSDGFLPVTVRGPILGGDIIVDGSVSSQFITGLLMALPLADKDTTIKVMEPVSMPYIDMTLEALGKFGIEADRNGYDEFFVKGRQKYIPCTFDIEGDWSAASTLLVAGALCGQVTVSNLDPVSRQADVAIIEALSLAGAEVITTPHSITASRRELNPFDFDATHCPDLFPALVALGSGCQGYSRIKGAARLMNKESDRALALSGEFEKMGVDVVYSEDEMIVSGGVINQAQVDSHNDHRIAMACAVASLRGSDTVTIREAQCVSKSYPAFWNDLQSITCNGAVKTL